MEPNCIERLINIGMIVLILIIGNYFMRNTR